MNLKLALASIAFFLFINISIISAQKIRKETIEYSYLRLPLSPLSKEIKNYQASIDPAFEAKNKILLEKYDADKKAATEGYEKETREFAAQTSLAEERYLKEMEEYNKKSIGKKLLEKQLLNENNKPVKQLPSKPYLHEVAPPKLQSSYDYKALAGTNLRIDGLNELPDNAVKVIVTLYGYDYTLPRQLSDQKDMLSVNSSGTNTYKSNYYHTEFSYRHPMSAKVILPDGKEILNITPSQLNIYKIYTTSESENQKQVNSDLLIKSAEAKVLQDNLTVINNLLNDKYGYSYVKRSADLHYIKNGGSDYADLTMAFNEASSGLIMLQEDSVNGGIKLLHAIEIWNNALKESDTENKKARIDKDVTIDIYYNLLEAYFALKNVTAARDALTKLNAISLSKDDRKIKNDYEILFTDLNNRLLINK